MVASPGEITRAAPAEVRAVPAQSAVPTSVAQLALLPAREGSDLPRA